MIAVVGAGAWGTALAQVLAVAGTPVSLWARDPDLGRRIEQERRNPAYLPGIPLHPAIRAGAGLEDSLADASVVILAVPTHGLRDTALRCLPHLAPGCAVVSAAKGFETATRQRMSEVLGEVMGEGSRVAVMSGPNIAIEVARGLPAATVVAAADPAVAARVRDVCTGTRLRVYSSADVVGVEYGGALKNVVAIAAGICDGLEAGDNGKAALMTRGIAEMARLGVRAGAMPMTFAGLAGLGDLVVTCMSPHSRNRSLGEAIARGRALAEVTAGMVQVAEGVNATAAAVQIAERMGVEMPIVREVHAVLFEGKPIAEAIGDLMSRGARDELDEFDFAPFGAG